MASRQTAALDGLATGLGAAFAGLAVRRPVLIAAVFFIGLWAVLATAEEAATEPTVLAVRLGVDAEGQTRVVFDADVRPDFVVTPLADGTLAVTIRGADFVQGGGTGTGAVTGWLSDAQTATLRLAEPSLPVRSFVLPPSGGVAHYRLVIDLDAASEAAFASAAREGATREAADRPADAPALAASPEPDAPAGVPAPRLKPAPVRTAEAAPAERPVRRTPRAERAARTVVIDPGHGGYDPGASGPNGLKEEAITLDAALILRTVLQARGYAVVLTREEDSFVPLDERVEIARRAHADLFLSLHADAHDDAGVRGASVYTLSDQRADRFARELKSDGDFALYDVALSEEERDVGDILFDIASTETRNASGRLAATLVDELSGRLPMVNNTHRKGSLRVLLSPDVPAVLVEMAFISNPEDEANLGSKRWRRRAMTAVADGIDAYFGEQVAMAEDGAAGG